MVFGFDATTGHEDWRVQLPGQDRNCVRGYGLRAVPDGLLALSPDELALLSPEDGKVEWSVPLGGSGQYVGYRPPAVDGERAFAVIDSRDQKRRRLVAVDMEAHSLLWEADVGPLDMFPEPDDPGYLGVAAASGGSVLCYETPRERSVLVCFDAASGSLRWRRRLAEPPWIERDMSRPLVSGGVVVTEGNSGQGHVRRVFRLADGAPLVRVLDPEISCSFDTLADLGGLLVALPSQGSSWDSLSLFSLPALAPSGAVSLQAVSGDQWSCTSYMRRVDAGLLVLVRCPSPEESAPEEYVTVVQLLQAPGDDAQ
jgi:outer membrane protein assembly factor BamB